MTLPYRKVLVTGASGFIGTRVCEHLVLAQGATVRGTYHRPARAARVARLDIELVRLDLADPASIEAAVSGCDAVVHCAYGTSGDERTIRELTGGGAGRVAEAALRHGARRFVHLSSIGVWGFDAGPGAIDEDAPTRRVGHPYVDGKIDAETTIAKVAARGLPAVVLRPGAVYGPWAGIWTIGPLEAVRDGDVAIVGNGDAFANTVYIDNLVSAILLGLSDERAVGGTFVVVDEDGLSWRDLYGAYARMLSPPADVRTVSMNEWRRLSTPRGSWRTAFRELRLLARSPEAAALARAAAQRPALRRVGTRLLRRIPGSRERLKRVLATPNPDASVSEPQNREGLPSPELAKLQTSGGVFHAQGLRSLGWTPPVQVGEAFRLTGEWLRFARKV